MLKAYKYRIYPTKKQEELINKHIGSVRFLYNLALETKLASYAKGISINRYDLQKQLVDLKQECQWLKEVNSQSLQVALMNLDAAYLRFFKGQNSFPKYKSKHKGNQSFNIPQNIIVKDNKISIPKFKEGIKIVLSRDFKGIIRQATISKTPTNKYFVSILCETGEEEKPRYKITKENSIGLDLGIKHFIIDSNGNKYDNPKFLRKNLSKLKFLQRKYSKYKGKRTKRKLALLHEKIKNQRKDFLHKLSSKIISENQTICLEDLAVKNMLKNHKLALSISDVSWSEFIRQLTYKSEWNGNNILTIGRFEPSSKTCSSCGYIKRDLTLDIRKWKCPRCSKQHDRDINAAINIKNFALVSILSDYDRKTQEELPTLVGAMTSEVSLDTK